MTRKSYPTIFCVYVGTIFNEKRNYLLKIILLRKKKKEKKKNAFSWFLAHAECKGVIPLDKAEFTRVFLFIPDFSNKTFNTSTLPPAATLFCFFFHRFLFQKSVLIKKKYLLRVKNSGTKFPLFINVKTQFQKEFHKL